MRSCAGILVARTGYHGLIPERVETVTSVTTRRSRDFDTPFGTFSYRMLHGPRYAVGAILESAGKTSFLMASPEKALADKVWTDKRFSGLRLSDYDAYLSDDLRIDRQSLDKLDCSRLQAIAMAYDSAKINNLIRCLKHFWYGTQAGIRRFGSATSNPECVRPAITWMKLR